MMLRAVLAGLAILAAHAPVQAQASDNREIGARFCGSNRQAGEDAARYEARLEAEDMLPKWIWDAVDKMESGPETMSFNFHVVGGERVLAANGVIDDKAADRFRKALRKHAPVGEVWFNSPGGNSEVGMEMGRILHDEFEQAGVRVRAGEGCASACSTAFLGGFMREIEPGGLYGVHMYSTSLKGAGHIDLSEALFNDIQWQGAKGASGRLIYVQQMGISLKWLDLWSTTPPGCMTFLSQDELKATLVSNVIR
jgi:hypothetical protein